jgi:very-short-patch-repair endonuclease
MKIISKFHLICSCIICKKETTVQSLSGHYTQLHISKLSVLTKICPYCGEKSRTSRTKFCSHSCAARYNNALRDYSIIKVGPKKGNNKKPPYTRISWCVICGIIFGAKYHRRPKTCSKECTIRLLKNLTSTKEFHDKVKHNRGRHKRSYMESSFQQWLDAHIKIEYIMEYQIYNKELKKYYYADFYFPTKSLIIELDGTQHKNTIEADSIRDNYIRSLGLTIIRVSYYEYKKKLKIPLIVSLLSSTCGRE